MLKLNKKTQATNITPSVTLDTYVEFLTTKSVDNKEKPEIYSASLRVSVHVCISENKNKPLQVLLCVGHLQLANMNLSVKKTVWRCTKITETGVTKCAIGNRPRHLGRNFADVL